MLQQDSGLAGSLFWQWFDAGQEAPDSEGGGRGLFGALGPPDCCGCVCWGCAGGVLGPPDCCGGVLCWVCVLGVCVLGVSWARLLWGCVMLGELGCWGERQLLWGRARLGWGWAVW